MFAPSKPQSIKPLRRPHRKTMVLALAALGSVQSVIAEEKALPEVAVNAPRITQDPARVSVSAQQIGQSQARDIGDVLGNEPGVAVGGGGSPLAQKVYVRGMEETLLNISLDGARQNGGLYHHQGGVLIDPQLLKTVEVQKGSADASAGPGALAGSIKLTTKDAADLLREGERFGALLGAGYFSNDGWRGTGSVYGRMGENFDALAYLGHSDLADYVDGHGERVAHSASEQDSRLVKLGWNVLPGQRLALSWNSMEESGSRYLRPNMVAFSGNNLALPSTYSRDTFTLAWQGKERAALPGMELSAYLDDNENLRTSGPRTYGERLVNRGADARLSSTLGAHTLKYGINYAAQEAEAVNADKIGKASIQNGATNTGQEDSTVLGLYLQDDYALGDQWLLGAGLRYDWYDYTDNHSQRFTSSGVSPSASLSFMPSTGALLRLAYTESKRGVGPKEVFLLDNGPGPRLYRNDADLSAEHARNLELSGQYRAGIWALRASVFELQIEDHINTAFIGGQARRMNLGTLKSRGYELGADAQWQALSIGFSVAHAKPSLNGRPLSDGDFGAGTSYGRSWNLNLAYAHTPWNMSLGWNSRVVEAHDTTAGDATEVLYTKEGYHTHDLYAEWLPTGRNTLRTRFTVRNVFDAFYYDQASYAYNAARNEVIGLPQAGRDVRVEVSYQF